MIGRPQRRFTSGWRPPGSKLDENLAIIAALLDAGTEVSARDKIGGTPCTWQLGGMAPSSNLYGRTPLHRVAEYN